MKKYTGRPLPKTYHALQVEMGALAAQLFLIYKSLHGTDRDFTPQEEAKVEDISSRLEEITGPELAPFNFGEGMRSLKTLLDYMEGEIHDADEEESYSSPAETFIVLSDEAPLALALMAWDAEAFWDYTGTYIESNMGLDAAEWVGDCLVYWRDHRQEALELLPKTKWEAIQNGLFTSLLNFRKEARRNGNKPIAVGGPA